MAAVVEHRRFSLFNAGGRNNKFWNITLYDSGDVEVHYGSQGQSGQRKTFTNGGRSLFEKKIREKTAPSHHGGPYTENKVLEAVESTPATAHKTTNKRDLAQKAINDIGATQPELAALIKYFADVNQHNLFEASGGKITYDTSAGKFKTTQGVITLDQIDEARRLLNGIAQCAETGDFASTAFFSFVNPYLSLIPQRGLVRQMNFSEMFSKNSGLHTQNDILDGLESSYAAVLAAPKSDKPEKKEKETPMFKVTFNVVDQGGEIDKVRRYYRETKGAHGDVQQYDVFKVYQLTIQQMFDAFEKRGKGVGNVMRLWHGTSAANMLSIMKVGMIVPRSGGSIYVTGRMFGDGLYFSDQSTKSIRYATGAWGGVGRDMRKFMFLVDVAMGKFYVPRGPFGGKCPAGYDSTFAQANKSGVMNNEMIVYTTSQANPVYLIEFTPYGR
jgi:poly [ADP-ribose] polymerase